MQYELAFKLMWVLRCCFGFHDFDSLEDILQVLFYFIQKLCMLLEFYISLLKVNLGQSITVD